MADITDLLDKEGNDEQSNYVRDQQIPDNQVLTAEEFVDGIVKPIIELQGSVVKSIKRGTLTYSPVNGVVTLPSDATQVSILTTASTTEIVSITGKVSIPIAVTSVEGGADTAEMADVSVQVFSNGEYVTKGSIPISTTPFASPVYTSIDITKYLTIGSQQVRLVAVGRDTMTTGRKVFTSIVMTSLKVEFASDYNIPIRGSEINPYYYIYGSGVSKTLHIKCSGKLANGMEGTRELSMVIGETTYNISPYTGVSLSDSASQDVSVITHGVHKLEAWLTCVDGEGNTYESEHIHNQLMVVTDETSVKPYLMLQNVASKAVNYEQLTLLDYAIYNPSGTTDIAISVSDYSNTKEYLRIENKANAQTKYTVLSTIEVEDIEDNSFYAYIQVYRYEGATKYNFMSESTGNDRCTVNVDNSDKFAPTTGADFYLNPKTRNNTEANPATIVNAANGDVYSQSGLFTGFGFVNDGWVTDEDGVKILRVVAGQRLRIPYEPWEDFKTNKSSSMTLELDFKVKNVTDENTAIIKCCSAVEATGLIKGLYMRPMDGYVMTDSAVTEKDQNFGWMEGERVHICINVVHALKASPTSTNTISLVRVFVNNNINREFIFKLEDGEFIDASGHGGIYIGQDDADIDIYSIRCYRKALSTSDIERNYVATLKTSAMKLSYRAKNAIMQDGLVNYTLAKAKYNTMVWHGTETSHTDQASVKGWLEITKLNADGTVDKAHSGTICKDTSSLPAKGQGSTAKTYYYWNQQYDIKDISDDAKITVNGEEVKDGWIDGNGEYKGGKFILSDNAPEMKKAVLKINYASSMQSHKQGATNLYNDLHTAIVGKNTMQQTKSKARVCVYEETFLYFTQSPTDSEPVFRGLGTFGSGKMDEPTWGFDKSVHKDFMMLEGSDNSKPLTDMRVPWEDSKVTWNAAEEYYEYAGNGNIDLDKTGSKNDDGSLKDSVLKYPKAAWNFLFMHDPQIKPYIHSSGSGNYARFIADETVDKNMQYWMTASDSKASVYDVYRWDIVDEAWVHAGMPSTDTDDGYAVKNLATLYPAALSGVASGDWDAQNNAFIASIVADAKTHIGEYFNARSLMFHYAFVNHLLAGTDNCSKNTYYVLDPSTHLFEMHQDDLDTIFKTDNSGYQIKPYYIDRMHKYSEDGTLLYTEGNNNVLFNLIELMYEDTLELSQMLKTILTKMEELITAEDAASGLSKNAWGCLCKYFFAIQEYFPDCAYNETARLRYEYPESLKFVSDRGVKPIAQSLGSQLPSEKQYMKRRLVYMSSYAAYGEFDLNGDGGFGFEMHAKVDGTAPTVVLDVTPHQYLYPTGRVGQTLKNPHVRLVPNQTYHFVLDESGALGDTVCGLKGANYYKSFGNLGDLSINPEKTFQIAGERLTEIKINPTGDAQFRTTTLTIVAPLVKTITLKGSTGIKGQLDLTSLTRLRTVDVEDTAITQVRLPYSELFTSAKLGRNLTTLSLDNVPKLSTLTLQGYQYLRSVNIGDNLGDFDSFTLIVGAYTANAQLTSLKASNVSWTNCTVTVLNWLMAIEELHLDGEIAIYEQSTLTPSVMFELKNAINIKFGNVDDAMAEDFGGLKLNYAKRKFTNGTVNGAFYNDGSESYQFNLIPENAYQNAYTKIKWSVTSATKGGEWTIDENTGELKVARIGSLVDTATITAKVTTYYDGVYDEYVATKTIEIWDRPAKVGDYVYADGTFSDILDNNKTVVAICFWVAPTDADGNVLEKFTNPNDKQKRLAISLTNISATAKGGTSFSSWQWGCYPNTDASNSLYYTNESGSKVQFTGVEQGLASGYFYDIKSIANIASTGLTADPTNKNSTYFIGDNNLRDETTDDGVANNGFRNFSQSVVAGDGFAYNETQTNVGERTLTSDLAILAGSGYAEGDIVNGGYAKTLKVIHQRNAILNNGISQVGISLLGVPQASPSNGTTELDDLANLMEDLRKVMQTAGETNYNKWSQVYYPAASAAYSYEPKVTKIGEVLSSKFKSHNWFLPTAGQLARLYYYYRQGASSDKNIFKKAIVDGKFANFSAANLWSVNELNAGYSWTLGFGEGRFSTSLKHSSGVVFALVAF